MEEKIFKSNFKLDFILPMIEKEYSKHKEQIVLKCVKIFTWIIFIISLGPTILISLNFKFYKYINFQIIMYTSYFTSFILFINLVIVKYKIKKIHIMRIIIYVNYYLFTFVWVNFLYQIGHFLQGPPILFFALFSAEMIFRLIWVLIGILGFIDSLIIISSAIITEWAIYGPMPGLIPLLETMLYILSHSVGMILMLIFSYFLVKQQKRAFYFYHIANMKAKWFSSILESMNTGYMSLSKFGISYVNTYLSSILKNLKFNQNMNSESNNKDKITTTETNLVIKNEQDNIIDNLNSNPVLNYIFMNIKTDLLNKINNFKNKFLIENAYNNRDMIKMISSSELNSIFFKNFNFIGEINIPSKIENNINDNNANNSFFEVFFRMNYNEISDDLDNSEVELIFNDITRTKINEEQKSEFKYKTLFLSKVAHEFKNPLICITELIDQVYSDNFSLANSSLKPKNILKNCERIKSMSNFLLVLVKNLEYFSQIQLNKNIDIELGIVDIKELTDFLKQITKSLLKKFNKSKNIKFSIHISDKVPHKFETDEWKLKQILINLLSNSVKFTIYGKIVLDINVEIVEDKPWINFIVNDTGSGINEIIVNRIFQPFEKFSYNSNNNNLGAGLGLCIVNELSLKLGGNIKYNTKVAEGTSFYLSIPLKETFNLNIPNPNDSSEAKQIHIIEAHNDLDEKLSLYSSQTRTQEFFYNKNEINLNSSNILIENSSSSDYKSFLSNTNKRKKFIYNLNDVLNISKDNFIFKRNNFHNILVIDDEKIARMSTIRILQNASLNLKIDLNIFEAEDGIETIFIFYKLIKQGIKISMIFSDETMQYMRGISSYKIIKQILQDINLKMIPFFLVTALSDMTFEDSELKILPKPLKEETVCTLFLNLNM